MKAIPDLGKGKISGMGLPIGMRSQDDYIAVELLFICHSPTYFINGEPYQGNNVLAFGDSQITITPVNFQDFSGTIDAGDIIIEKKMQLRDAKLTLILEKLEEYGYAQLQFGCNGQENNFRITYKSSKRGAKVGSIIHTAKHGTEKTLSPRS